MLSAIVPEKSDRLLQDDADLGSAATTRRACARRGRRCAIRPRPDRSEAQQQVQDGRFASARSARRGPRPRPAGRGGRCHASALDVGPRPDSRSGRLPARREPPPRTARRTPPSDRHPRLAPDVSSKIHCGARAPRTASPQKSDARRRPHATHERPVQHEARSPRPDVRRPPQDEVGAGLPQAGHSAAASRRPR